MKKILKLSVALGILLMLLGVFFVNLTSAATFSKDLNNAILMDYPAVNGNEHYSFIANYTNGYGVWHVYKDYYWCSLNNGRSYTNWHAYPRVTEYYSNGQQVYNTTGTRYYNSEPAYYPGDLLLFTDTADFSAYTSVGNSEGVASDIVYFSDFYGNTYEMYLELGINY